MQNVARRHGQAVGFILPATSGCDVALRVFTPTGEIATCLDTALAAASVLRDSGRLPQDRIAIATRGADTPIRNVSVEEMKTLVPLGSPDVLDTLAPGLSAMAMLCEQLGSTGLYLYDAQEDARTFDARHFPSMSLVGEDAATGDASTALAFGLLRSRHITAEDRIFVRQGRAIGRPSRMVVHFRCADAGHVEGCWLSGTARLDAAEVAAA